MTTEHSEPSEAELRLRADPVAIGLVLVFAATTGWICQAHSIVTVQMFLDYANQAQAIMRVGLEGYTDALHPIGYSLLLIAGDTLTGNMLWGAKLLSLVSGVLSLVLLHRIASRVFGSKVARLTLVIVPIGTLFTISTLTAESMMPSIALQLLVVELMMRGKPRAQALAGAVAGLAFLVRYQSIVLLGLSVLWLLTRRDDTPRARLKSAAFVLLPFLAITAPQMGLNLSRGLNPVLGESSRYLAQEVLGEYSEETAGALLTSDPTSIFLQWTLAAATFVGFNPFLIAGFLASCRSRRSRELSYLNAVVVIYTGAILANLFSARSLLFATVLTVPYLAHALPGARRALGRALQHRETPTPRGFVTAGLAGLLLFLALPFLGMRAGLAMAELRHLLERDEVTRAYREITRSLYANGYQPGVRLLGCSNSFYDLERVRANEYVAYRQSIYELPGLPDELPDAQSLMDFMREHEIHFVLYQPADPAGCPTLDYLLEPENLPADFTVLFFDGFFDFEPGLVLARLEPEGQGATHRPPIERSTADELFRLLRAIDRAMGDTADVPSADR